ncbi:MAG: potassium-transporting ATPase subunit C, partial [Erysipelotrichaceae bacterium]|nr:potassium-transporting ATPase subunit C [Erysipelotrichaceae bacterium]
EIDGKKYGSQLLGQQYNDEKHMWGRIVNLDLESFTDEDGNILMYGKPSNLSVESQQYQQLVQQRIDMIRQANPDMDETKIPVELITCSASGVDPDISYSAAIYQVKRIAKNNNMTEQEVLDIIDKCKTEKLLGIFGQETVNVLKVNLMLEGILQ